MLLETERLTKRFGALTALDGVELAITANEVHAIIGPNGAGKTTLFNLLMGVYAPTEGRIKFDGLDITEEPINKRPELGISRSYQITNVYPSMTVFKNLQTAVGVFHGNYYDMFRPVSSQTHIEEKTAALLEQLELEGDRETEASNLSHGDKRHLEIGMALAAEPQLLLLDEPTAGMGAKETRETMKFIEDLADEMAVALVEHNIEGVMRVSDTITVLEQGEVIAADSPNNIRQNETVQNAYLGGETHA
jgi:branched-chain amino acid transport system ATP-binding protein